MEIKISHSTKADDYEILIRKQGDGNYASYCPQLNLILYGKAHTEVLEMMRKKISEHTRNLQSGTETNE
ncbi:MAG TPA: hypothetical protein PLC04_00565 [Candidatus Kapabacteria bacterium]|jgi:hypothetical protein|nr:hypothetical protein [Candidatus Kapabacteria bacterium]